MLDACWEEVEGTASGELLAALHDPGMRERRIDALHYLETLLMRDLSLAKLREAGRAERAELADMWHRTESLRLTAMAQVRAEEHPLRREGPKGFEQVCGWLVGLLLPREYEAAFGEASLECGLAPERTRLPSHDWWAWAVRYGWLVDTTSPAGKQLLSLDQNAFVERIRRVISGAHVAGSDDPAVVERWERAFKGIEEELRSDLEAALAVAREARGASFELALTWVAELYEELADLRVQRRAAVRRCIAMKDEVAGRVNAATDSVREWCCAAAADRIAEEHAELWDRVRTVVWEHRSTWEREGFTFTVDGSALADRLRLAVREHPARQSISEVSSGALPRVSPAAPGVLAVATDASGFGPVGGYAWVTADGRSGGGKCVDGKSSVESELIAICEAALAPELSDRRLRILSDCDQAVEAVNAALRNRTANTLPFTVSAAVQDYVHRAIGRAIPFSAKWIAGHDGHPLNEEAHRLARAARW
ncbi:RNase H family protein [Nocardia sp. NPDC003693]